MAVNKIIYGGNALIDLTGDTVTAGTLIKGVTAHDSSGNEIVGIYVEEKDLFFENVVATESILIDETSTYGGINGLDFINSGFSYYISLTLSQTLTNEYIPEVFFNITESVSGNFSNIAVINNGNILIFLKETINEEFVIPLIKCTKVVVE